MSAQDKQVGGDHYKAMVVQPAEWIARARLSYHVGNMVKYVSRWRAKGGTTDLIKAWHYGELALELGPEVTAAPGELIARIVRDVRLLTAEDFCAANSLESAEREIIIAVWRYHVFADTLYLRQAITEIEKLVAMFTDEAGETDDAEAQADPSSGSSPRSD